MQQTESLGSEIEFVEVSSNNELVLSENLVKLLDREEYRDKRLFIVSLAGTYHSGKSFLLNLLLRFLQHYDELDQPLGNRDDPLHGFSWRRCGPVITRGINVWFEPVLLKRENNEDVLVLLMETEGIQDMWTSVKTDSQIFSFSLLMSDVHIHSLSGKFEARDACQFRAYVDYAKQIKTAAMKEDKFKNLIFLIRDWDWAKEHKVGFFGGHQVFQNLLKNEMKHKSKADSTMQFILDNFQSTKTCPIPYPGKIIQDPDFDGRWEKLDTEFIDMVGHLCYHIFYSVNNNLEQSNEEYLTGATFIATANTYLNLLNNINAPFGRDIYIASLRTTFEASSMNYFSIYQNEFNSVQLSMQNMVNLSTVHEIHETAKNKAMSQFHDANDGENDGLFQEYKKKLLKLIEFSWQESKRIFEEQVLTDYRLQFCAKELHKTTISVGDALAVKPYSPSSPINNLSKAVLLTNLGTNEFEKVLRGVECGFLTRFVGTPLNVGQYIAFNVQQHIFWIRVNELWATHNASGTETQVEVGMLTEYTALTLLPPAIGTVRRELGTYQQIVRKEVPMFDEDCKGFIRQTFRSHVSSSETVQQSDVKQIHSLLLNCTSGSYDRVVTEQIKNVLDVAPLEPLNFNGVVSKNDIESFVCLDSFVQHLRNRLKKPISGIPTFFISGLDALYSTDDDHFDGTLLEYLFHRIRDLQQLHTIWIIGQTNRKYNTCCDLLGRNRFDNYIEISPPDGNNQIHIRNIIKCTNRENGIDYTGPGTTIRRTFGVAPSLPRTDNPSEKKHVLGLLSFCSPGLTDTELASHMVSMLPVREPKLVNGCCMLDEYGNEYSVDVDKLLANAVSEQPFSGSDIPLQIILINHNGIISQTRASTMVPKLNELKKLLVIEFSNDEVAKDFCISDRSEIRINISTEDQNGHFELLTVHAAMDNFVMDLKQTEINPANGGMIHQLLKYGPSMPKLPPSTTTLLKMTLCIHPSIKTSQYLSKPPTELANYIIKSTMNDLGALWSEVEQFSANTKNKVYRSLDTRLLELILRLDAMDLPDDDDIVKQEQENATKNVFACIEELKRKVQQIQP